MSQICSANRYAAVQRQVSCDLNGEAVILKLDGGIYYGLNEVGARVWALLQESSRTVDELISVIVEEYEVEPDRCGSDVHALLADLSAQGLIEEQA